MGLSRLAGAVAFMTAVMTSAFSARATADATSNQAAAIATDSKPHSGNPIFQGWYADPEAQIFKKQYWIYPTYSAKYNQQVFFDAFSSPDLIHSTKHSRILDTNLV